MAKTIVGLFDDFTAATLTVPDLIRAGIPREHISVVANDTKGEFLNFQPADEPTATVTGAGAGAAVGGLGGLLIGLGALAIPGIGPLIAAGPIATTIAGVTVGAAAGSLIGAFHEVGVPESDARYYIEGIRRGGTVLTATVDDAQVDEAMAILRQHKVVNIEERAAQWRQEGWTDRRTATAPASRPAEATQPAATALDMDDGRVLLRKEPSTLSSLADAKASSATPHADTSVIKVASRYSPTGKYGQKYLASGIRASMRLWEEAQPGAPKASTQQEYETIGYVIKGRAELEVQGQTILLEPGDSWVVPKGASHRYTILEPFTAIEATSPPAEVHGRDETDRS
jgi:mannose-6-phosphate isomerase-like protein (cupin superfamily)/uncharacterized membrane protein